MKTMEAVGWPRPVDHQDLYDYYSELRAAGPISRSDVTDSIVVTGFDAATADWRLGERLRFASRMPTSQNRDMGHPALGLGYACSTA